MCSRTREETTAQGAGGGRGSKATLVAGEEISYFCSGKSVAPVSEAAKGEPRTIDRVRASFFVFSSRDPAFSVSLTLSFSYTSGTCTQTRVPSHAYTVHGTPSSPFLALSTTVEGNLVYTDTVLHAVCTGYLPSSRYIVAFFPRSSVSPRPAT